jgi:hypothetical protein
MFVLILNNIHRFVRGRRRPVPAGPDQLRAEQQRTADARFLARSAVAAVVLVVVIAVVWSMI